MSVHREGVDPSSMDGEPDLDDHIIVNSFLKKARELNEYIY